MTTPYTLADVSVEGNIQKALTETAGMNAAEKMSWFYQQVKTGGDMDYKNLEPYNSDSVASEAFGNFNYGVVGTALGIPAEVLKAAAGWQQYFSDLDRRDDGDPATYPHGSLNPFDDNYGDSLGDQDKIKDGIEWAEENDYTNPVTISDQVAKDFLNEWMRNLLHPIDVGIALTVRYAWELAQNFLPRYDPLTFDLDGDGLETLGINPSNPILFDHDGDGIKHASGWVNSDDAFLVLDRNGNGIIDNGRGAKKWGRSQFSIAF